MNPSSAAAARRRASGTGAFGSGRAFTLIELVVVIILLGVLAGMVAPRVLSGGRRTAEIEAQAMQGLVSIFAERHATGSEPVALEGTDEGVVFLLVRRPPPPEARDQTPHWKADALVEPVTLASLTLARVTVDGQTLQSGRAWRVVATPATALPTLDIELNLPDTSPAMGWRVLLGASAAEAVLMDLSAPSSIDTTRAIDLDAAGGGQQEW